MEDSTLEREPNPQPNPHTPKGALDRQMRMKLAAVGVFLVILIMVLLFFLSRKTANPGIVRPRPVQTLAEDRTPYRTTAAEREGQAGYEKAKHDMEALRRQIELDRLNRPYTPPPAAPTNQSVPQGQAAAPQQSAKQDYEQLLRKAAYSDNIVEIGRKSHASVGRDHMSNFGSGGDRGGMPNPTSGVLKEGVPAPIASNALPEWTVIECALVNQLTGDNTGPVLVQVSNDVFLPGTRTIVIPQGTRLFGEAKQVSLQGQQRLAVAFHRLLIGTEAGHMYGVSLDQMPGLDQAGATALKGQVNNHYARIFGASLALGALGGLAQIGNGGYGGLRGYDAGVEFRNGVTQSMAQSSEQILNRGLNMLPTITIPPGTRVDVSLAHDLELPPYEAQ